MALYLIAFQNADSPIDYSDLTKRIKDIGDDCQTMDNVFCLRSQESLESIYQFLSKVIFHPDDKFILAQLQTGWLGQNIDDEDDCYEDKSGSGTFHGPITGPPRGFFDPNPSPTSRRTKGTELNL